MNVELFCLPKTDTIFSYWEFYYPCPSPRHRRIVALESHKVTARKPFPQKVTREKDLKHWWEGFWKKNKTKTKTNQNKKNHNKTNNKTQTKKNLFWRCCTQSSKVSSWDWCKSQMEKGWQSCCGSCSQQWTTPWRLFFTYTLTSQYAVFSPVDVDASFCF